MLYNIRLKTSLFEVKLYYVNFMRLFLLRKPRNLEAQRINSNPREVTRQVNKFSCDFHCSKTILTFFLQIIRSERLLTIVLNVKRCFNTNKEPFLSAYLLITGIHTYWTYGDGIALPRTWKSNSNKMEIYVLCSL